MPSLTDAIPLTDAIEESVTSRLGVLIGFITTDDAHSPVVLPHWGEVEKHFEGQIPLRIVDVKAEPHYSAVFIHQLLVYSVPTLLWMKANPLPGHRLFTRHVGTTTAKKIIADMEVKLEELLG